MKHKSWSLARRVPLWFACSTAGLVLVTSAVSAVYIDRAVHEELDALANEELAEFVAVLEGSPSAIQEFGKTVDEAGSLHPDFGIGSRLWDGESGSVLAEHGVKIDLEKIPADHAPNDEPVNLGGGWRWRSARLGDGRILGVILDGSGVVARQRRFEIFLFGFASCVIFVSGLGGLWIGRRVSMLLRRVAERARAVRATSDQVSLDVEDAPAEIREVSEALQTMLQNIREEARQNRLITAGLAHELRSPIQNLVGETEVALLRRRNEEEYRRVLVSHLEELRDLGRVVDNLVTLCSSQEAQASRAVERFDLGEQVHLRLAKEHGEALRSGIDLELTQRGDLVVEGDREALLLAVRNLVMNALQWTPRGRPVRVELFGERPQITITVDDAGPGVPPGIRGEIFKPFVRGPSRNGERVGYGLGLALTRTAVEAHGGTVLVADSPLGGARFVITLPRRRQLSEPLSE